MQTDSNADKIKCPKCGHEQPKSDTCAQCSIIFKKYFLSQKKKVEKEKLTEDKKIKEEKAVKNFQTAYIGQNVNEEKALQAIFNVRLPDDNLLGVFKVEIDPKEFGGAGFLPVSIYLLLTGQGIVLWDFTGTSQLASVGYSKIKSLSTKKILLTWGFTFNLEDGKVDFRSTTQSDASEIENLINQQIENPVSGSKNLVKEHKKREKNSTGKTNFKTGKLTTKKSSGTKIAGFIALAVLIYIPYCAISFIISPSDDTQYDMCNDDVRAYVEAMSFVKRKLKSPSTADFPWGSDGRVAKSGNCTFVVRSYVDSQNSFGAMMRTNYVAKLKPISKNHWELIDIKFYQ